jgi:hypothetical protein
LDALDVPTTICCIVDEYAAKEIKSSQEGKGRVGKAD